jgi:hypothetical protein
VKPKLVYLVILFKLSNPTAKPSLKAIPTIAQDWVDLITQSPEKTKQWNSKVQIFLLCLSTTNLLHKSTNCTQSNYLCKTQLTQSFIFSKKKKKTESQNCYLFFSLQIQSIINQKARNKATRSITESRVSGKK